MTFAKVTDGAIESYPVYDGDIRLLYPGTSFPALMSANDLPEGYVVVEMVDPPSINRWQRRAEQEPQLVAGVWMQVWTVADTGKSLAEKRAEIKQEIETIAAAARSPFVVGVSAAEMASWPIKRSEATAFSASYNNADAPSLLAESNARGISLAVLVDKVLAKSTALTQVEAAIAGRCGALQDAAGLAEDDQSLLDILADAAGGWPVAE